MDISNHNPVTSGTMDEIGKAQIKTDQTVREFAERLSDDVVADVLNSLGGGVMKHGESKIIEVPYNHPLIETHIGKETAEDLLVRMFEVSSSNKLGRDSLEETGELLLMMFDFGPCPLPFRYQP